MGFQWLLVAVFIISCAQLIWASVTVQEHVARETPAIIQRLPTGQIPLTSSVFVNCPVKNSAALDVTVNGETSYFSCFDLQSKSPIFTLHQIKDVAQQDLPRPDVDPWYDYNDDKNFGNGKSIIGGFDRGHLSPSADFAKTSTEVMKSTFYVMNRAAQVASFNRNNWRVLETIVRIWVESIQTKCKSCQAKILTGTTTSRIGTTSEVMGIPLPIPKYYYKIVMVFDGAKSYAALFYGLNDVSLTHFPIHVIGSSEDVQQIPTEILQDLLQVLELSDLLLKDGKGMLYADGKAQLLQVVPDALVRLQK